MMAALGSPTPRRIGWLFAVAVLLLAIAAWMVNFGGPELSAYAFPPLLIGLVLLAAALTQLALWALNRAQQPPAP